MHSDRRNIGRALAGLLLAALLSACQHVDHLRDAQELFNETAALENKSKFSPDVTPAAIQSGYSLIARSLVSLEEDRSAVTRLREDKLYGNVLVLKAMTYWRLRDYKTARDAARDALALGAELPPGTRDYAFLKALEGLIRNDQAYAKIYGLSAPETEELRQSRLQEINDLINSADGILVEAGKTLPERHPMNVYLSMSRLIAVGNLSDACYVLNGRALGKATDCYEKYGVCSRAEKIKKILTDLGMGLKEIETIGASSFNGGCRL